MLRRVSHFSDLQNKLLGIATAISINKITFTEPATGATLTLADGSTFATVGAFASTFTFTGITGVTFPTTGTLATLAETETLSGKTITALSTTGNSAIGNATTDAHTITGFVGQGVAPTSEYGYRMSFTGATATSQYGFFVDAFSSSTGTAVTTAIRAKARTSAAAYTCTNVYDIFADTIAAGAGSTITNAYGFFAQDQTAGGTLNVGVASTVSSGTGKWNIRASGTANNAFAGNTRIGSTVAPTVALDVTGAIYASTVVKTGGYTVATLPAGVVGMRAYVTDALAPAYGVALAGGGAVTVPAFYNGAAWIAA